MFDIKYIITLLLVNLTMIVSGQTIRQLEKAGDLAMTYKDYYAAITHYGEILSMKNERLDIHYKYALAANSFNAFEIAEKSLLKVSAAKVDGTLRSDKIRAKYLLGDTQKKLGKYNEAIESFREFIREAVTDVPVNQELINDATKHLEDCEWANEISQAQDNYYEIIHMGDEVNTPFTEFAPVPDQQNLYFSTLRYPDDSYTRNRILSFSKVLKEKNGVVSTILLDNETTTDKHIAHTSFYGEHSRVIFTVCGYSNQGLISCNLYTATAISDDSWGNIVRLPEPVNLTNTTSTQPNLANIDGINYLFFVSDREGGAGGLDIWRSKLNLDGTVENPENLHDINTEEDDISPFFHTNTNTLYFSSEGYQNMGGFDVYHTRVDNDQWGKINHFGTPLNTSYDDVYFSINDDESVGYISTNRPGSKYLIDSLAACCYDLFRVDFESQLDLIARVFDEETKDPIIGSLLKITEQITSDSEQITGNTSHVFDIDVYRNRIYELTFSKAGYESKVIEVSTQELDRMERIEKDVNLKPLPINLLANSFDQADLAALDNITYTIAEWQNESWIPLKTVQIEDVSALELLIEKDKRYRITAVKDEYKNGIAEFDTYNTIGGTNKVVRVLLAKMTRSEVLKKGIDDFLPVPLYFDNNQPAVVDIPSISYQSYGELAEAYYARKPKFTQVNTVGLSGEERTIAGGEVENFFDNEMIYGKESLDVFCSSLFQYLALDNTAEIMIQGYTSPLADINYNLDLGKRRISSIRNHIDRWNEGALLPYMQNGALKITIKSFGESTARPGISDNPMDQKNSIFSIDASRERRVEIIEVK
ncbi:MAG: PD40 domain-containing protein [Bacteroidia bacterium]|nr:PD40 domain-containing protein [Bacteroidia bacterium]